MKVELKKGDVLEVVGGEGGQGLILHLAMNQADEYRVIHAKFASKGKASVAHYTLSSTPSGEMDLALFGGYDAISRGDS